VITMHNVHGHRVRALSAGATFLSLAVASLTVASCGRMDTDPGLDATAVRAVARSVEAAVPDQRLVVLHTVDGPDGDDLSWGVQQSLTTAGMELGDTTVLRDESVRLLAFVDGSRVDGEWLIRTRLMQRDAPAVTTTWRVRCDAGTCEVLDARPPLSAPAP
jgi:hypothetical protein